MTSAPLTVDAIIRLLVCIVRQQWLESTSNQNICEQVKPFLSSSSGDWIIGINIYTELTLEMSPHNAMKIARDRRAAFSFRDTVLTSIFETGVETLDQICKAPCYDLPVLKTVLKLIYGALSFDFMGSAGPEASDSSQPVMIPMSWTILRRVDLAMLLFDSYKTCLTTGGGADMALRHECALLALRCLVEVVGIRRSWYKDSEIDHHLASYLKVALQILQTGLGINQSDDCYHEFCRLTGRLTSTWIFNLRNYLQDVVKPQSDMNDDDDLSSQLTSTEKLTSEWFPAVCEFTLTALRQWNYQFNSKHHLMEFWAGLVHFQTGSQGFPEVVTEHLKTVFLEYLRTCLKLQQACAVVTFVENGGDPSKMKPFLMFSVDDNLNDLENPIENEVVRGQCLDKITQFGSLFRDLGIQYLGDYWATLMSHRELPPEILEVEITWLIYMISALVLSSEGKPRILQTNTSLMMDTKIKDDNPTGPVQDIVYKIFNVMVHSPSSSTERELAYLELMDNYRKVFQPDLDTEQDPMLETIIMKICQNMKSFSNSDVVLSKTISVFKGLVFGVISGLSGQHMGLGELLVKSHTVNDLLTSPRALLNDISALQFGKHRTSFYYCVSKLFLMSMRKKKDSETQQTHHNEFLSIQNFLQPLADQFDFALANVSKPHDPVQREAVAALFRDLTGVTLATPSWTNQFFNWLINRPKTPEHSRVSLLTTRLLISQIHLVSLVLQNMWSDYPVAFATLKFIAELTNEKSKIIEFRGNSPYGLILFHAVRIRESRKSSGL